MTMIMMSLAPGAPPPCELRTFYTTAMAMDLVDALSLLAVVFAGLPHGAMDGALGEGENGVGTEWGRCEFHVF